MKFLLKVDSAIVDSEIALKVLELINGAEFMEKHWKDKEYRFVEPSERQICMTPVNMAHYAEAQLNIGKED